MHNVRELHNWVKLGKTLVNYASFSDPELDVLRILDDRISTQELVFFCWGIFPAISFLHTHSTTKSVQMK